MQSSAPTQATEKAQMQSPARMQAPVSAQTQTLGSARTQAPEKAQMQSPVRTQALGSARTHGEGTDAVLHLFHGSQIFRGLSTIPQEYRDSPNGYGSIHRRSGDQERPGDQETKEF